MLDVDIVGGLAHLKTHPTTPKFPNICKHVQIRASEKGCLLHHKISQNKIRNDQAWSSASHPSRDGKVRGSEGPRILRTRSEGPACHVIPTDNSLTLVLFYLLV